MDEGRDGDEFVVKAVVPLNKGFESQSWMVS